MGFLPALELVPNQITFSRLLLLFPLWYTAIFKYKTSFAFFFLLAGFTDFLDGYLARRLGQATHYGAAFDSFVDNLIALSVIFWVYWLMPELVLENLTLITGLVVLLILTLGLQLIIYHRFLPLHLYTGKLAVTLLYLFLAHAVLYPYSKTFFVIVVAVVSVALLEELILTLQRKTVHEGVKSIFH